MSNDNDDIMKLGERALLCGLSLSLWGNRKLNKTISNEASASRGMGDKVGRFNNWLLIENRKGDVCKEYTAIITVRNKAGVIHRELTLPWMDNGMRINSSRNHLAWCQAVSELKDEFDKATSHFCNEYDHLVERTKLIMDLAASEEGKPSMFQAKNYPNAGVVRSKFRFETHVMPLPEATDFRAKLSDDQITIVKRDIKARQVDLITGATMELFIRLGELVDRVMRLGDPKAPVTSALERDVRSITSTARRLNIGDDKQLEEMIGRIEKELSFNSFMLKTTPSERDRLAQRAERIAKDMAGFFVKEDEDE